MSGRASSVSRHAPKRLVSRVWRTSSRSASTAFVLQPPPEIPALLTRTSRRPRSLSTEATAATMLSSSVTSSWTALAFSPSSRATSSPVARSREPITTRWPRSASWRATSRPMPRFPPETSATRSIAQLSPWMQGRAEVAVVGAGIVGLAAADALARAGMGVVCFEAAEPGSGQSAGHTRVFRHVHDRADLVELVVRARRGWDEWSELARQPLVGDEGVLFAAPDVEETAALFADVGVEHRMV